MTSELSTLTGILILATLVEALVEYLVKPLLPPPPATEGNKDTVEEERDPGGRTRDLAARYSAAGAGILLCLAYRADLLALAGLVSPVPWIGYVVTGLLIGRGSNFVHDFAGRWLAPALTGGSG